MNQKVTFSNFHSFFWLKFFQNSIKKLAYVQPTQMSRVHFEEAIPAFADVEIDNTDGEVDEGAIDETRKGNRMEDVEMRMNSQDVEADMTDDIYGSTDEDAETGGKKKKNKASSFSPFRHLAQRSSKDSTTKEIFCTSRRGCASQHPSTTKETFAKRSI